MAVSPPRTGPAIQAVRRAAHTLALVACLLLLGPGATSAAARGKVGPALAKDRASRQPNVLILLFDDLRFDSFSYRGGPVPTPNIDALAAQSTRFDTAITTTGLCSPSRAALFTGRWGHRTGLDDIVGAWRTKSAGLDPAQGGIIRRAADAGYYVGYIGKWHLGANGPALRGAQYVSNMDDELEASLRPSVPYSRKEAVDRYLRGERDANGEKTQYYETQTGTYAETPAADKVRSAKRFLHLAVKDARPFFGVVSFKDPHPPYRVPQPYAGMFDPAKIALPKNFLAPRVNTPLALEYPLWPWHNVSHMTQMDWRKARAHYLGNVAMIDHAVGEIIAAAKREGVYDSLRIVLLSDQGSMIGEHGLYDKAAYAFDELMRIPLIVRDPKVKPRVVSRHVSLMDVPATLAEWMQLAPDGPSDGHSLVQLMQKGDAAIPDSEDAAIYAYELYNGVWAGIRAIRTPDWKYVWNPADSRDELYALKIDAGEMVNRIDDPALATQLILLRRKLTERLHAVDDPAAARLDLLIAATAARAGSRGVRR